MKRIKKAGPVFIAILILCFLVTMPPAFAKIQEETLLNRVVSEEIPENVLLNNSKEDLSVADKLDLIINGRMGNMGTAVVDGGLSVAENDAVMSERACLELKKLIDRNAIPEFNMSDCNLIGGNVLNYVDLSDMGRSVSVMWLHLEFVEMDVDVLMDMETSQIYEYNLYGSGFTMYDDDYDGGSASYSGDVLEDEDLAEWDEAIWNFQEYTGLSWEEFDYYYDCAEAPWYIGLR